MCIGGGAPSIPKSKPIEQPTSRPAIQVQQVIDPAIIKSRGEDRSKRKRLRASKSAGRVGNATNRGTLQSSTSGLY